jgi:Tfp pilus assembly protein PilE
LFAILLGGLGAHRFYLGQWWGIFYLLLFWTLIPGLIALVEGIVFLCTSDEKWDHKYNDDIPSSNSSGALIILVVVVAAFMMTAVIGILAAIAIPAYQDYVVRAKVATAIIAAEAAAQAVGGHVEKNQVVPRNMAEAGHADPLPAAVRSITIDAKTGVLTVTLQSPPVEGRAFILVPSFDAGGKIIWRCAPGDLQPRYLPSRCREHAGS